MNQISFHAMPRLESVEKDVTDRLDALKRFGEISEAKVTVTKTGKTGIGLYEVKVSLASPGLTDMFATESDSDVKQAIAKVFDCIRRILVEANDKRRIH